MFAPDAHPDVTAFVTEGMAQVSMPGYGQAAKMLASGRLLEDLSACSVPCSVIYGAEDVVTPPDNSRKAYAALPEAFRGQLIAIDEAGTRCLSTTSERIRSCFDTLPDTMKEGRHD